MLNEKISAVNEVSTVSLTNSLEYPFNDSVKSISLAAARTGSNYIVDTMITSVTGGSAGDIVITDRLNNGFKMAYTGGAASVGVAYTVRGG